MITPAHNEEQFIEGTIKSVLMQTILPQKWLIIDYGSSDATYGIIKKDEAQYSFISCLRLSRDNVVSYYYHMND